MWKYLALLLLALPCFAGTAQKALRATAVHLPNGSGAVVEAPVTHHRYILTNWHVCHHYASALVQFPNGKLREAKVYRADPGHDLCALTVDQRHPALKLATETPVYGSYLATRGWPKGSLHESEGTILHLERMQIDFSEEVKQCPSALHGGYRGRILTECSGVYDFWHTDLFCMPGSSGSPVVNQEGELVGVMQTWDGPQDHHSGGVLPLEYVQTFLKGL